MARIFKTPSELPNEEGDDKFWTAAGSEHVREMVVFQLINELSTCDALAMTDGQCRSKLAKCEGIVKMMFLKEAKANTEANADKTNDLNTHDQIPEA